MLKYSTFSRSVPSHSKPALAKHGIEHHQPFYGAGERNGFTVAVVRLSNRGIEGLAVHVVDVRSPMRRGVRRGKFLCHQGGEEVVVLLTVDDASVDAVLATDADAGVQHDGHQEARLAVGEALLRDGVDALGRSSRQQLLGKPRVDAAPASSGCSEASQAGAGSSIAGESGPSLSPPRERHDNAA